MHSTAIFLPSSCLSWVERKWHVGELGPWSMSPDCYVYLFFLSDLIWYLDSTRNFKGTEKPRHKLSATMLEFCQALHWTLPRTTSNALLYWQVPINLVSLIQEHHGADSLVRHPLPPEQDCEGYGNFHTKLRDIYQPHFFNGALTDICWLCK